MNETGCILFGANNIFSVATDKGILECRIKGKILQGAENEYAPLAPGDRVILEKDAYNMQGRIIQRETRKNKLTRWNKKKGCPQTIGVNIDMAFVVSSPVSPPFRPRFIDRVILSAELGAVPITIIVNKKDQGISKSMEDRLALFKNLGYSVNYTDALTGEGLEELKKLILGRRVILIGQSGVGKTTLLNNLFPGLEEQKTAEVSLKWNRGKHTTNLARLFIQGDFEIVDTPGIREIEIAGIAPEELKEYFPELEKYNGNCEFPDCLHINEPGCAVLHALDPEKISGQEKEDGISMDRYRSYLSILNELRERKKWK